jgi:hypothetical protein
VLDAQEKYCPTKICEIQNYVIIIRSDKGLEILGKNYFITKGSNILANLKHGLRTNF